MRAGIFADPLGNSENVIREVFKTMTAPRTDIVGFAHPRRRARARRRRTMLAELIASVALVVSIAIAATAVSIGIARAGGHDPVADTGGHFAVATLIGLVLVGLGALTAIVTRAGLPAKQRE